MIIGRVKKEVKMNVYFIVHGSIEIGMGHVMRSLSLAEAFRERGHRVCFFSKYKLGISKIRENGFKVNSIPFETKENDIRKYLFEIEEEMIYDAKYIGNEIIDADVIFVDSYDVDRAFFNVFRNKTKCLAYVDDLNSFSYPVDILVNGSASAFYMGYEKTQPAQLLLGVQYNLLRKEFCDIPLRNVKPKVKHLLITTGNSDPCKMTEQLLNILHEENCFKDLIIHVIKGSGFAQESLVESALKDYQNVFLHDNPANMVEIMLKCDFAITAGGSTIYELAACGVPAIAFAYADNQIPQITALEKERLLKYIGFWDHIDKKILINYIQHMQLHYEERRTLVHRLQRLVDAKGAIRVVEEVEKFII